MESISTIEHLKKRGVKDRDIQMFELHMQGGDESTFKAIAKKFGLKSAVTVSRRIKKVQKALAEINAGIKSGDITLESAGVAVTSPRRGGLAPSRGRGTDLFLPDKNPFFTLDTFSDLSKISSAGGSVMGMGAATLYQGFAREDLPYEDRSNMAMKGAAVLAGGLLSAFLTFQKFAESQDVPVHPQVQQEDDNHE